MKDYPEKYNQLIDTETWAFIRRTLEWYPPDTIEFSVARQREIYNAMCREFMQGYPAGVTAVDHHISDGNTSVPVRKYQYSGDTCINAESHPGNAHVVYFHGGGFVVGGLESHDDICSEICSATGFTVTAVDYRLSPEHAHPAAFEDAMLAVKSLACEYSLVLCGDSAGGNLTAAVCHAVRSQPDIHSRLSGQVLIYPGLGGNMNEGSYVTHANAPMLTTQEVRFYSMIRSGGQLITGDPTSAPLHDECFENLPPTVVVSAECDPLSDDGRVYCENIRRSRGKAVWYNETGLVHGYLRGRTTVERARRSFDRIVQSIQTLGSGLWIEHN